MKLSYADIEITTRYEREYNEYSVAVCIANKRQIELTYYASDREDAHYNAKVMLEKLISDRLSNHSYY